MSECKHARLIKQSGPMDGGEDSRRYRCEICNEFVMVTLSSAEIGVSFGAPAKTPDADEKAMVEWVASKLTYGHVPTAQEIVSKIRNWPTEAGRRE
jgi:hypothetical protein